MNKILPYILLALIMSGCSADDKSPSVPDALTPVVLSAWTPTVGSRAVIESGDVFSPAIAGWETASSTPTYTTSPTWLTSANVTAASSQQPISLADPQYYNHDSSISTHMLAWFPKGEINGEIVTFANTDGSVDAMMANPITGTKDDSSGKVLSFSHLTTQLKFKVVADASLPQGTGLKSITVKGVSLPVGFNLTERNASFSETLSLTVPGITSPAEITGVATPAGNPVMVKPMAGNTVKLDIETTESAFKDVVATIDGDTDFIMGKAYVITLMFRHQSLGLYASVSDWAQGSGSANVE